MGIFVSDYELLNFDLGRWAVQIRVLRPRKLSSTEFHAKQITFGTLHCHIRAAGPHIPLLYIKYIGQLPNV